MKDFHPTSFTTKTEGTKGYVSASFNSHDEANEWIRYCSSFNLPTTKGQIKIETLVDDYLKGVEHVKDITLESYRGLLRPVVDHFGQDRPINITQLEINDYVRKRRREGAGRVIAKELGRLRSAFVMQNIQIGWTIPRSLSAIQKKDRYTPTSAEVKDILSRVPSATRVAILLCALAGFRPKEAFRAEHRDIMTIPGKSGLLIYNRSRKTGVKTICPACSMLIAGIAQHETFPYRDIPIIEASESAVNTAVRTASGGKIRGLQAFRRYLVTTAEDAGFAFDQIALVTGHKRSSMTSRYSSPHGHMDLKLKIIESVERSLT